MTLTFPVSLTIEECENFLVAVDSSDDIEELLLPVDVEALAFGGLASAIQAVNTWARKSSTRKLKIRGSTDKLEDLVEGVISRPYKFCASMLARSIQDTDTSQDLRPILYVKAENAIAAQSISSCGQQRGALCWFVFVDHSTKGFDRNFYLTQGNAKPAVRQLPQIRSVIQSMMDKSVRVAGGGKKITEDDIQHIGRMFYELFLNSHEHGSRGRLRANWLKPGLRLIYTNAVNLAPQGGDIALRGAPPVDSYLKSLNIGENDRRRFIEISIVDSGLGFAGRWSADHGGPHNNAELTLENEYLLFQKCLSFRQTSSDSSTKGNGLPVVMDRLTKLNGFMKVRSGRLSVYRNFVMNPYSDSEACSFSDWMTGSSNLADLTQMPPVAGVVVTVLIPLEAKQ